MGEAHREDRVTRLHQRHVRGEVRLATGVWLYVGVLGTEQLLGTVDRELLDLVDDLAATVVAASWIALGVLVGEHRTGGFEHRARREVLAGDQLDLVALAVQLPAHELGERRVRILQWSGEQVGRCSGGHAAPPGGCVRGGQPSYA